MQGVTGNLGQVDLFCTSTGTRGVRSWEAIKDAYKEVMGSMHMHTQRKPVSRNK
jgi:hypothetical protein